MLGDHAAVDPLVVEPLDGRIRGFGGEAEGPVGFEKGAILRRRLDGDAPGFGPRGRRPGRAGEQDIDRAQEAEHEPWANTGLATPAGSGQGANRIRSSKHVGRPPSTTPIGFPFLKGSTSSTVRGCVGGWMPVTMPDPSGPVR